MCALYIHMGQVTKLIAKPGNKTAAVPWPDPYDIVDGLWRTWALEGLGLCNSVRGEMRIWFNSTRAVYRANILYRKCLNIRSLFRNWKWPSKCVMIEQNWDRNQTDVANIGSISVICWPIGRINLAAITGPTIPVPCYVVKITATYLKIENP